MMPRRSPPASTPPAAASSPYSPAALFQAVIRVPDLHPENAWPLAQAALHQAAAEECRQAPRPSTYAITPFTLLRQPALDAITTAMYATYYLDDQGQPKILLVTGRAAPSAGRAAPRSAKAACGPPSAGELGFLAVYLHPARAAR